MNDIKNFSRVISFFYFSLLILSNLASEPMPASILFSPPLREEVRLSPDGEKVSYLATDTGKTKNIFIKTIGKNDDRTLFENNDTDILNHYWSFLPDKILFFRKTDDKKSVHLYITDINTKLTRDLTPFSGINAKFLITDHRKPDEIVSGIEINKKGRFDLYIINLTSGAITELAKIPEDTISVKGDLLNRLFISESVDKKTYKRIFRIKTEKTPGFTDLLSADITEDFRIIDFSEDGKSFYALSDRDKKFTALVRYDIESGKETEIITSSQKSDIDNIFFNHYSKKPVSVAYDFMKRDISILDSSFSEDFQTLSKLKKGNLIVLSNDIKNEKWLLTFENNEMPPSYHIYNRTQKRTLLLFLSNPEYAKFRPSKRQPFTIKFGENEKLLLFVTLPQEQSAENFPLILNLTSYSSQKKGIRFDPVCQFFSSRGFACISFNHSGIRGFGKDFYNNAYSKNGIIRVTDEITTVIKWAIDRNIANPQQITVLSDTLTSLYSLNAITKNSDLIHMAVFIEPLFSGKHFKDSFDIFSFDNIRDLLLIPIEDKKSIHSQINQITVPSIFLLNKKSDIYNSGEIIDILTETKKKNKDISIIIYPVNKPLNTIDFFQRLESVLSKYFNTDFMETKTDLKTDAEIR
ncbi:MAG: hypothetical protein N3B13_02930 [Deltaproteobacteria bacterium]|nr:hypothetical protein [Deltaproteobacteria bacterium]